MTPDPQLQLPPPPTRNVHARPPGREAWAGSDQGRGLARFLGYFSLGLGAAELFAPAALARSIGLDPSRGTKTLLQGLGARELAAGFGILANPGSKEWVGTRIGGDLMDLALLAVALGNSRHPGRTLLAAAAVLGVTALDVLGAEQLAEARKVRTKSDGGWTTSPVLRSITIGRPRSEVYALWRDFSNLPVFMKNLRSVELLEGDRSRWHAVGPAGAEVEWESEVVEDRPDELIAWRSVEGATVYSAGRVTFADAPSGEATVVAVEMSYAPPGGKISAALLKILRKEPGQQIGDDLRRLKQYLETGEVLLSDASAKTAHRPHSAQPPSDA